MAEDPEQMRRRVEAARQGIVPERPEDETARRPMTPQQVETWVDQSIRQAQRRGDFDNLRGAGKPLRGLDRPHDPDWWVKSLVEREQLDLADALPGPMALRRERATFPQSLLDLSDERQVRERLEDFNERVLADRRRPHVGAHPPPVVGRVDVEELVQAWRAARAALPAPEPAREEAPQEDAPPPSPRRWWRRRR